MSSDTQWDFTPNPRSRVVSAEPSRPPEAPSPPAPPPRPQKALSPVRTQCPSRSPAPARRPGASPQECGPGPGSGQQDSRGGNTIESRPGKGNAPVSTTPPPPPSTAALAGKPAPATFTGCRRGAGRRGCSCVGGKGPRTPSPGEQRGLGEEEGAQGLRRPHCKQPAQPRHTPSPPHISPPPLFQTLAPRSPTRVA